MHRLVIALLSALDALITVAVGVAFVLAPLTLFWATTPSTAWADLWPTTGSIWQLGHLVSLHVGIPELLQAATGVAPDAATFVISLAPLAFAAFAIIAAARSGIRAARSGAWLGGFLSGTVVFAGLAALIHFTSGNEIVATHTWQALLFPVLIYAVPLLVAGIITAWTEGDEGLVDMLHDRVDELPEYWSEVPALAIRGVGVITAGLIGTGALVVLLAVFTRGGEVIALFQSNRVDLWGAVLLTLVHLAYLPTLVVWGTSFAAGPGFSVGAGSTVSPAGADGVAVPALPLFGLLPENTSPWLFALVLLPIGFGAFAGWILRSRYAAVIGADEPLAPRAVLVAAPALLSAELVAAASALASGGIGPGRLEHLGPNPGFVALAVGIETAIGLGILLLAPRRADDAEYALDE